MVDQIVGPVAFTTPGAPTATFDITDPAITQTCKAAILVYGTGNLVADDAAYTTGRMGLALLALENGTNIGGTLSQIVRNGLATPQARNAHGLEGIRLARNSAFLTQFDCLAGSPSSISGGLRLDLTDATQVVKGAALLFAGSGVRAWAGTLQATTTPQHEDTGPTSPSDTRFQADIVIVTGCKELSISAGQSADCVIGLGAVLPSGVQTCSFVDIDTATEPSDADGDVRSANGAAGIDPTTRAEETVTFTIDSTGFNYVASAGTQRFKYLAIKFERSRVGVASNPIAASTGLQSFNGFGFSPEVYVGISTLLTTLDTLTDGAVASCAGYSMGNNRTGAARACSIGQEEGNSGTSAAGGREGNDGLLTVDHVGTLTHRASPAGPSGAGGFQLNFSTAAAAGYFTAIGFQIIPEPPLPLHRRRQARKLRARIRRRIVVPAGRVVASPPITRLLSLVSRARRAMQRRLRWKPPKPPGTAVAQVGAEAEEPKGIVAAPGLVRARVFGPGIPTDELQ